MAQAYSAGLFVTDDTVLRKERILPLKGEVKVKKGDKVKAEDVVAVTLLPGKVIPLNVANKLGVPADLVMKYLKIKEGDKIDKGQIIAQSNGFFGFFKSTVKSPTDGEVESISKATGNLILREPRIPVEVKAFIDGVVVEEYPKEGVAIENRSTYIQGIFGLGGETTGEIKVIAKDGNDVIKASQVTPDCKGKLLVCGALVSYEVIKKAQETGVNALIAGGVEDGDLKKLLGYDIGVAITGHEQIGLSIIVTEGFGKIKIADKTFELLKKNDGKKASTHGKTQIRAGVMRPEIIIPLEFDADKLELEEPKPAVLEPGTTIRIIRQPNFGLIGKITELPEPLTKVESETLVRILKAKLEDGREVTIPRANVEVIED
ncbi:MAG: hypothetical protein CSB55_02960 [Candidatus Cloacimonadota bacterium]|nr:MAG: hypothetical protein CSB55_02960 [Candidatus Cloacimonadota bacterium]